MLEEIRATCNAVAEQASQVQIDVERFVSNTHRTTTQLHRSAIGVGVYLVMTKALRGGRRPAT